MSVKVTLKQSSKNNIVVNGSGSTRKLAETTQVPNIKKLGIASSSKVDSLIVQINNLTDNKINRNWVANQLNLSSSQFNKCLQPDSPSEIENHAVKRAIKLLKHKLKSLEK